MINSYVIYGTITYDGNSRKYINQLKITQQWKLNNGQSVLAHYDNPRRVKIKSEAFERPLSFQFERKYRDPT